MNNQTMKTNLEKLIAATADGGLESDGVHLMAESGTIALSTLRSRVENPQNFQRIALSWNRFPEAVDIVIGVLTALSYPRGSEAQVRCLEEIGGDARTLLATIEKEAQL